MGKRLFGTDGIRGVAGESPLDPKTVTALGLALAADLTAHSAANRSAPTGPVLIGMDTRESGPAIAAQLAAALAQGGVRTEFAGVITTPGVAYLTRTGDFAAGVMISASHNPFQDNGIKVFARTGYKLPDDEEHEIEESIFGILPAVRVPDAPPLQSTYSTRRYLDFLLNTLSTLLHGRRIVLDCGNGAASALAPELFREAGAEVTAICNRPDGRNINLDCGALHLEKLQAQVLETGADAGVAFDGDADRALLVAPSGRIVDGDAIMLIAGRRLQSDGHLKGNLVVSTVMSNLGLEKALGQLGISMLRTGVGDKYVLEEMIRRDAAIGGEQSGHIIFRDYATTGDGMLTALKVLETSVRENLSLDELAADLKVFPQLLVNVRVKQRKPLEEMPKVREAIAQSERALAGSGRVLVRFSGTEPLLRVMVEGEDRAQIESLAGKITDAIHAELG
ncbi:MAG: phosphoglucosamine mutase [Acidobacteriota bacterium]|nr:phosphoglucosamine mutase [Acidobacteriota bacterium]